MKTEFHPKPVSPANKPCVENQHGTAFRSRHVGKKGSVKISRLSPRYDSVQLSSPLTEEKETRCSEEERWGEKGEGLLSYRAGREGGRGGAGGGGTGVRTTGS